MFRRARWIVKGNEDTSVTYLDALVVVLALGSMRLSAGFCWTCHVPRSGHCRPGLRDLSSLALAAEHGLCHRTITLILHRRESLSLHWRAGLWPDGILPQGPLCAHVPSCSGRLSVSGLGLYPSFSLPGALFLCFWHMWPPPSSKAGSCYSFTALTTVVVPHSVYLCVLPCFPHWNLNSTRTRVMSVCLLLYPTT